MHYYPHSAELFHGTDRIRSLPMVYVVTANGFEFVKIGQTKSPKQRLRNLQSGCPFPLRLWLSIRTPIPSEIENYLHAAMDGHSLIGEWFSLGGEELDYLQEFARATNQNIRDEFSALLQA